MKRLIASICLLFPLLLWAQEKKSNEPKAAIQFETLTHDFGKVYDGKQVEYEFVFTNTGKAPLILSNVQPSCGCTTPEWPREPVMPGQKAKIKAIYNPGSYRGTFNKSITVYSNAEGGNIQLIIKGTSLDTPKDPQSPVKIDMGGGF